MPRRCRTLLFVVLIPALLMGCAARYEKVVFDKNQRGFDTIEILPTRTTGLTVIMASHPGDGFGELGDRFASDDMSVKRQRAQAAVGEFAPMSWFEDELKNQLQAKGYEVVLPTGGLDSATDLETRAYGFRASVAPSASGNPMLEVSVAMIGFYAFGATDNHPYRPTAAIRARLLDANGRTVLFSERIATDEVLGWKDPLVTLVSDRFAYPRFKDLEAAGRDELVAGLEQAVRNVAAALANEF